jgi:hypothetical protein
MKGKVLILISAAFFNSCSDSTVAPDTRDFNLKFAYGIGAKNVLNTFQNTYTKDLILDGTTKVPFFVSEEELHQIKNKMDEIGFFSYPDTFIAVTTDSIGHHISPYATYDFEVQRDSAVKHLMWMDAIVNQNSQAIKLRELISLVRIVIESKPEYSKLPAAKGGYD